MLDDPKIKKLRQKSYHADPLWRAIHKSVVNMHTNGGGSDNKAWLNMPGDDDCQYAWTMMVMMGFEEIRLDNPVYRHNSPFKIVKIEWLAVPDPNVPQAHGCMLRCASRTLVMFTRGDPSDQVSNAVVQVYGNPFLIYQFNWSHIGLHMAKGAPARAAE